MADKLVRRIDITAVNAESNLTVVTNAINIAVNLAVRQNLTS